MDLLPIRFGLLFFELFWGVFVINDVLGLQHIDITQSVSTLKHDFNLIIILCPHWYLMKLGNLLDVHLLLLNDIFGNSLMIDPKLFGKREFLSSLIFAQPFFTSVLHFGSLWSWEVRWYPKLMSLIFQLGALRLWLSRRWRPLHWRWCDFSSI